MHANRAHTRPWSASHRLHVLTKESAKGYPDHLFFMSPQDSSSLARLTVHAMPPAKKNKAPILSPTRGTIMGILSMKRQIVPKVAIAMPYRPRKMQ